VSRDEHAPLPQNDGEHGRPRALNPRPDRDSATREPQNCVSYAVPVAGQREAQVTWPRDSDQVASLEKDAQRRRRSRRRARRWWEWVMKPVPVSDDGHVCRYARQRNVDGARSEHAWVSTSCWRPVSMRRAVRTVRR
jgi:hypothetical protein